MAQTAEELAAQELQDAIDRGDYVEGDEPEVEEPEAGETEEEEEEIKEEPKEEEIKEEPKEELEEEPKEEPKEEEEVEEEVEDDENVPKIPRSRLNQEIQKKKDEVERREAAEDRTAWLEDQLEILIKRGNDVPAVEPKELEIEPYDFDAAEDKRDGLLMEGEMEAASNLRKEISKQRQLETKGQLDAMKEGFRDTAKAEAEDTMTAANLQTSIDEVMVERPYLDHESDEYNERAVRLVNSIMNDLVAEGKSKAVAIREAAKEVAPLFEKEKPKDEPKLGDDKKATKRDKDARKKAVKADKTQPPAGGRNSNSVDTLDVDTIDILKMPERDFNKLTKAELSELRGDKLS